MSQLKRASPYSYKRLEQLRDRPSSTIHGWCTGKHLPCARDNDPFIELLELLGADPTEQQRLLQQAIQLRDFDAADPPSPRTSRSEPGTAPTARA